MYQVKLHESYFAAQTDYDIRDTTVGGILRAAARERPEAHALLAAGISSSRTSASGSSSPC